MTEPPQILVVDDDREMKLLLRDFLVGQGYNVAIASSGKSAMAFFKSDGEGTSPKLVLADVKMAPVNGLELALTLSKTYPRVSVILFSAYANDALVKAAISAGAKCFLKKPFSLIQIASIVKEELQRSASSRKGA